MGDIFLQNGDVRLHVIEGGEDRPNRVPLLIVPGLAESAEDYVDLIQYLAPRRCVAATLRGRGRSDAPQEGYSLQDHVGDISLAKAVLGPQRVCLLAFSRGVAYALGYALGHVSELAGLILGDFPALHSALPPAFPDRFLTTVWRGKPAAERISAHAINAIQREAKEIVFWEGLRAITCPSLILHGARENGSLLSPDDVDRYRCMLRGVSIVNLQASGHDLRHPDPAPFAEAIRDFLSNLDNDKQ
jgi:pimeloyl-ACP methyl ester carboxylesterase